MLLLLWRESCLLLCRIMATLYVIFACTKPYLFGPLTVSFGVASVWFAVEHYSVMDSWLLCHELWQPYLLFFPCAKPCLFGHSKMSFDAVSAWPVLEQFSVAVIAVQLVATFA